MSFEKEKRAALPNPNKSNKDNTEKRNSGRDITYKKPDKPQKPPIKPNDNKKK